MRTVIVLVQGQVPVLTGVAFFSFPVVLSADQLYYYENHEAGVLLIVT